MRAVCTLILLALLMGASKTSASREAFDPFSAVDIRDSLGAQVPLDTVFRDSRGQAVTLGALLDGRPAVLAPVYYTCPNVCSVTLASVMSALSSVPFEAGEDYVFIAYSIDPREGPSDAAEAKREALSRLRPGADEAAFHFLTGETKLIEQVSTTISFGYAWDPEVAQYAHAAAIATVTPEGRLARWLYGLAYQPTDLRLAILEAGQGTVGDAADKLLLLCYRYDPNTGQYSGLVRTMLMTSGGLTLAAIGALIGGALWRERRARRAASNEEAGGNDL